MGLLNREICAIIRREVELVLEVEIVTEPRQRGVLAQQDAKKIYSKICKDLTQASLNDIGSAINRGHDSVINSINRANDHYEKDPEFRKKYGQCKKHLMSENIQSPLENLIFKLNDEILMESKKIDKASRNISQKLNKIENGKNRL